MAKSISILIPLLLFANLLLADSPIRPDPKLTPGATLDVTKEDILTPGYTKKVRDVPQSVKDQVYAEYGITTRAPGEYEVDHLISLELGGSNSIKNLWPQSYITKPWNAHVKDRLENKLHAMVRDGQIDLKTAQQEIATDWIAAYKKYVGPEPGTESASPSRTSTAPSTSPATVHSASSLSNQVWVNTKSGVYWKPGTAYYGKTKQGEYMSEPEAEAKGYRAAKGQ